MVKVQHKDFSQNDNNFVSKSNCLEHNTYDHCNTRFFWFSSHTNFWFVYKFMNEWIRSENRNIVRIAELI